jgi:hypothetical protein
MSDCRVTGCRFGLICNEYTGNCVLPESYSQYLRKRDKKQRESRFKPLPLIFLPQLTTTPSTTTTTQLVPEPRTSPPPPPLDPLRTVPGILNRVRGVSVVLGSSSPPWKVFLEEMRTRQRYDALVAIDAALKRGPLEEENVFASTRDILYDFLYEYRKARRYARDHNLLRVLLRIAIIDPHRNVWEESWNGAIQDVEDAFKTQDYATMCRLMHRMFRDRSDDVPYRSWWRIAILRLFRVNCDVISINGNPRQISSFEARAQLGFS